MHELSPFYAGLYMTFPGSKNKKIKKEKIAEATIFRVLEIEISTK